MRVLDLFSGIGGFSLGLERAGMQTVAFCEIDKKSQLVLKKHWPHVPVYDDVKELSCGRLESDGITGIDVICGGFPCQDISNAGNKAGIEGERSGLWREYARLVGELRPRYIIVENVAALLARGIGRVLGDLAEIGYDTEWHCIPAAAVGAPHKRDRTWIVAVDGQRDWAHRTFRADTNGSQFTKKPQGPRRTQVEPKVPGLCAAIPYPNCERKLQPQRLIRNIGRWIGNSHWWQSEPGVCRVAYGIPGGLDRNQQLGNAVVPQIPELIGRAIMEVQHGMA